MTGEQTASTSIAPPKPHGIDAWLLVGVTGLLVASTMNRFAIDWRVFGREITLRPDLIVFAVVVPALAVSWLTGRVRIRVKSIDWTVLAYLFTNLAASMLAGGTRMVGVQGTVLLGILMGMYFVTRHLLGQSPKWLSRATDLLLVLGIAQAVYSLTALVFYAAGYNIGGLQIGHLTLDSVAIEGTFWEANLLAAFLGLSAVFLTVRYVLQPQDTRPPVYLAGVFLTTLALPLTMTRSAALAFGVGMLAFAAIVLVFRRDIRAWSGRAVRIAGALGLAAVLTVTAMNSLVSTLSRYPNLILERWIPVLWNPSETEAVVRAPDGLAPGDVIRPDGTVVFERVTLASRSSAEGRTQAWRRAGDLWWNRPLLGHGTLAGQDVIRGGWWYSSLVQALYDTGLAGFFLLLWIHTASVVYPIRAWFRARRHPGSASLLAFGLGNVVLVLTSQFSNFFFVGFPWVFLGMSLAAVDVWSKAQPEREGEAPAVPA
jgi:hypothetical protein